MPHRGARTGFVGAFVRTARRGAQTSAVGKTAVGALVVVLTAGSVVGLSVLLRGTGKTDTATTASQAAGVDGGAGGGSGRVVSSPSAAKPVEPVKTVRVAEPGAEGNHRSAGQPAGAGTAADPVSDRAAGTGRTGTTTSTGKGTGTGTGTAASTTTSSTSNSTQRAVAKPVTYRNVAGLGCAVNGASYTENGRYTNGNAGWWTLGGGSYTG
ncbi:hypothetical protein AB0J83_41895, partial [Actinoplanes sp. NPDC049596]